MNINILEMTELENGSAEIVIDMDEETKKYLMNFALIEIIKQGLVEIKELYDSETT